MATAKKIKERLRSHIDMRIKDVRAFPGNKFYSDVAYGAIWAANHAVAISDTERDKLLDELKVPTVEVALQ